MKIQLRKDVAADWVTSNPILSEGEVGVETDSAPAKFKIGDGVKTWTELDYSNLTPAELGIANGIATLGVDGKVLGDQLPQTILESYTSSKYGAFIKKGEKFSNYGGVQCLKSHVALTPYINQFDGNWESLESDDVYKIDGSSCLDSVGDDNLFDTLEEWSGAKDQVYNLGKTVTAKSVIFDFVSNYGSQFVGVRSIEFVKDGVVYPLTGADCVAFSASNYNSSILPIYSFDTTKSKTAYVMDGGNGWMSASADHSQQRLIVVFNSVKDFDSIIINNYHWASSYTAGGAKDFNVYISSDSITDTIYNNPVPNSELIVSTVADPLPESSYIALTSNINIANPNDFYIRFKYKAHTDTSSYCLISSDSENILTYISGVFILKEKTISVNISPNDEFKYIDIFCENSAIKIFVDGIDYTATFTNNIGSFNIKNIGVDYLKMAAAGDIIDLAISTDGNTLTHFYPLTGGYTSDIIGENNGSSSDLFTGLQSISSYPRALTDVWGGVGSDDGTVSIRSDAAETVESVAGRTGAVTLDKTDVGLPSVDNTSDVDKPISTAVQTALDSKNDNIPFFDKSYYGTFIKKGTEFSNFGGVRCVKSHMAGSPFINQFDPFWESTTTDDKYRVTGASCPGYLQSEVLDTQLSLTGDFVLEFKMVAATTIIVSSRIFGGSGSDTAISVENDYTFDITTSTGTSQISNAVSLKNHCLHIKIVRDSSFNVKIYVNGVDQTLGGTVNVTGTFLLGSIGYDLPIFDVSISYDNDLKHFYPLTDGHLTDVIGTNNLTLADAFTGTQNVSSYNRALTNVWDGFGHIGGTGTVVNWNTYFKYVGSANDDSVVTHEIISPEQYDETATVYRIYFKAVAGMNVTLMVEMEIHKILGVSMSGEVVSGYTAGGDPGVTNYSAMISCNNATGQIQSVVGSSYALGAKGWFDYTKQ